MSPSHDVGFVRGGGELDGLVHIFIRQKVLFYDH